MHPTQPRRVRVNRDCPTPETKFTQGVIELLLEITKEFPFSEVKKEPSNASVEEMRLFRVADLVSRTRKLAIRKSKEMPASFRALQSQDEWIQDAMRILYRESARYKPKEGCFYNDYMICFILPKRLIGLQRSVFRKNPPVDEELRQIVSLLRQQLKHRLSAKVIADHTGVSEERAQIFLDTGVGQRILVSEGEINDSDKRSETEECNSSESPLEVCLKSEFRRIVLGCIRKLKRNERYVIVRQYFSDMSLADIARGCAEAYEAVKSRSRRALGSVKGCVQNRYAIDVQAQGVANG